MCVRMCVDMSKRVSQISNQFPLYLQSAVCVTNEDPSVVALRFTPIVVHLCSGFLYGAIAVTVDARISREASENFMVD